MFDISCNIFEESFIYKQNLFDDIFIIIKKMQGHAETFINSMWLENPTYKISLPTQTHTHTQKKGIEVKSQIRKYFVKKKGRKASGGYVCSLHNSLHEPFISYISRCCHLIYVSLALSESYIGTFLKIPHLLLVIFSSVQARV